MILPFVTSHKYRGLPYMKKTQIGLFLLLLLLPFLCEATGTGFTPGRLLMLVRGSCWVLGPALGRSCGVRGGSGAWGWVPLSQWLLVGLPWVTGVVGLHGWPVEGLLWVAGGGTPTGDQQWLSPACPQGVSAQALWAGGGQAANLTWDFWAEQTLHWIQGIPLTQNGTTALTTLPPISSLQGMSRLQSAH